MQRISEVRNSSIYTLITPPRPGLGCVASSGRMREKGEVSQRDDSLVQCRCEVEEDGPSYPAGGLVLLRPRGRPSTGHPRQGHSSRAPPLIPSHPMHVHAPGPSSLHLKQKALLRAPYIPEHPTTGQGNRLMAAVLAPGPVQPSARVFSKKTSTNSGVARGLVRLRPRGRPSIGHPRQGHSSRVPPRIPSHPMHAHAPGCGTRQ